MLLNATLDFAFGRYVLTLFQSRNGDKSQTAVSDQKLEKQK